MTMSEKITTVEGSIYADFSEKAKANDVGTATFLLGTLRDYYTDHDRLEEGEALNWLLENGKRPYLNFKEPKEGEAAAPPSKASWFNEDLIGAGLGEEYSDLPDGLYSGMTECAEAAKSGKTVANHRSFDEPAEAVRWAVAGYAKWKAAGFPLKEKKAEDKKAE